MPKTTTTLAAIATVVLSYFAARETRFTESQSQELASRFRFQKYPLNGGSISASYKSVRQVHPSLQRISAWVSSVGASVTVADLDGDGLANDLILVDPRTDLVTISPAPTTGSRYTPFALDPASWSHAPYEPTALAPTGTLAGDFNEDGLIDFAVYFWGRTPVLFLRKPASSAASQGSDPNLPSHAAITLSAEAFTLVELTDSGERWFTSCASQADFDGDGHLDLLFGNYFMDGAQVLNPKAEGTQQMHQGKAKALNGGHKHLFLWHSATTEPRLSVRYTGVPNFLPEEISRGWTVAIGAADLDGDLLPEIYMANDFGPDRLLHNRSTPGKISFAVLQGERDFTTPKSCVLGDDSFKGMGVDFADVNGDGILDIYVSNIATEFGLTESHFLWLSTGNVQKMKEGVAPYVHGSEKLGLARSGFAWDARLADFDNDSRLEAMQACGFIKGSINRWPELQALGTSNRQIVDNPRWWPSFKPGADISGHDSNPFFVLGSDGKFHNVAAQLGLAEPMVSRGIAIADVDGDGRLDFACANQWGPSYFFKNESPRTGAFLGLRLFRGRGTPAVGAVAKVTLADGRELISQVDGGTGHSGHRSPEIHFGLGGAITASTPLRLDLRWRDSRGVVRQSRQAIQPGWHRLVLGDSDPPSGNSANLQYP